VWSKDKSTTWPGWIVVPLGTKIGTLLTTSEDIALICSQASSFLSLYASSDTVFSTELSIWVSTTQDAQSPITNCARQRGQFLSGSNLITKSRQILQNEWLQLSVMGSQSASRQIAQFKFVVCKFCSDVTRPLSWIIVLYQLMVLWRAPEVDLRHERERYFGHFWTTTCRPTNKLL
jgi:hypothetical protein